MRMALFSGVGRDDLRHTPHATAAPPRGAGGGKFQTNAGTNGASSSRDGMSFKSRDSTHSSSAELIACVSSRPTLSQPCLATKASFQHCRGNPKRDTDVSSVEHNIPTTRDDKPAHAPRRPDLGTFFSTLELVDTSDAQEHHNVHAQPQPENVAAVHRVLANAFAMMRGRTPDDQGNTEADGDDLLANMIEALQQSADNPPAELAGVPNSFLDELDRVPKKSLKATDLCPICRNAFLDGESGRTLAAVGVG